MRPKQLDNRKTRKHEVKLILSELELERQQKIEEAVVDTTVFIDSDFNEASYPESDYPDNEENDWYEDENPYLDSFYNLWPFQLKEHKPTKTQKQICRKCQLYHNNYRM